VGTKEGVQAHFLGEALLGQSLLRENQDDPVQPLSPGEDRAALTAGFEEVPPATVPWTDRARRLGLFLRRYCSSEIPNVQ
jgi:hypothetical protein